MSARTDQDVQGRDPEAEEILAHLTELGVVLVVDRARLRVRAPRGVLTSALRATVALHRDGLLALVEVKFRGPEECLLAQGERGLVPPCRRMSPCAEPVDGRVCLMSATCCLCGELLPPGRRYLCPSCSDVSLSMVSGPKSQGGHR